jgi:flagellin-like protein
MNINNLFKHTLSPIFGAILFLVFVLVGAAYIVWAKLIGASAFQVTGVPLGLMILYALALGLARYFRLRDDQAGDNLYYLGFLYTLTSLGVSLWQFSVHDGAQGIVVNFGVAIGSTILGVALRVVFNQMRQDPIEVERTARLELADAARHIKQELNQATLEFASFRRATQQMSEDALAEAGTHTERVINLVTEPLKTAAEQNRDTFEKLAGALAARLEEAGKRITTVQDKLASTTDGVTSSLEEIRQRLKAMQMPDGVIEIKLQPFIGGLTKAVNNHSKATADQMAALQGSVTHFDKTAQQLAEHMREAARACADDQQLLRGLLSKADAGAEGNLRLLAEMDAHMREAARARADDQQLLRGLLSKADAGAEGNRRPLAELDKKVAASTVRNPNGRAEPSWSTWLWRRAS